MNSAPTTYLEYVNCKWFRVFYPRTLFFFFFLSFFPLKKRIFGPSTSTPKKERKWRRKGVEERKLERDLLDELKLTCFFVYPFPPFFLF